MVLPHNFEYSIFSPRCASDFAADKNLTFSGFGFEPSFVSYDATLIDSIDQRSASATVLFIPDEASLSLEPSTSASNILIRRTLCNYDFFQKIGDKSNGCAKNNTNFTASEIFRKLRIFFAS